MILHKKVFAKDFAIYILDRELYDQVCSKLRAVKIATYGNVRQVKFAPLVIL